MPHCDEAVAVAELVAATRARPRLRASHNHHVRLPSEGHYRQLRLRTRLRIGASPRFSRAEASARLLTPKAVCGRPGQPPQSQNRRLGDRFVRWRLRISAGVGCQLGCQTGLRLTYSAR
jgi:hypothetical protein